MLLHAPGTAAGGGTPRWNCAYACRGGARARPELRRRRASPVVRAAESRWYLVNATPDIADQSGQLAPRRRRGRVLAETPHHGSGAGVGGGRSLQRHRQALHGRLGSALAHRDAGRDRPAVSRRGLAAGSRPAQCPRPSAALDLEPLRGIRPLPGHRLGVDELCRACPRKEEDFGSCRCQAYALTGDASRTDPACRLSPGHGLLRALAGASRSTSAAFRPAQPRKTP